MVRLGAGPGPGAVGPLGLGGPGGQTSRRVQGPRLTLAAGSLLSDDVVGVVADGGATGLGGGTAERIVDRAGGGEPVRAVIAR
jgi:hypothetical protein